MDRNVYVLLLLLAGIGLFFSIEWLFLTFLVLLIIMLFLERFAGASAVPPIFSESSSAQQQPVVIQATSHSSVHQLYFDMVSHILAQTLQQSTFEGVEKNLGKKIEGLQESITGKVDNLEKKLSADFKKTARH